MIAPDAELRARLRGLRLVSHLATAGQGIGQHPSRSRGVGLEFAQYRPYEPGDEPRRIDWKLYGRSDRYFVREAERDSPLDVMVLLDATASMGFADHASATRKLDRALLLAACMAELALAQNDRFGLVAITGQGLRVVPLGAGLRHRDRLYLALEKLTPVGGWSQDAQLLRLWEQVPAGSLVLVLSDFYDEGCLRLVEKLARARREPLSLQLLGADERDFPFEGGLRLRDPETGEERRLDASIARAAFLRDFGAARAALARRMATVGVRHAEHALDRPPFEPLAGFFGRRAGACA